MSIENLKEILPKIGMLCKDEVESMILCKPKILPIKSVTLERLEEVARENPEDEFNLQSQNEKASETNKLVL